MAKRFTLEILMDLAKSIGANPSKVYGNQNQYQFFGKRTYEESLVPEPFTPDSRMQAVQNLGKPETLVNAVEDAMSWMQLCR